MLKSDCPLRLVLFCPNQKIKDSVWSINYVFVLIICHSVMSEQCVLTVKSATATSRQCPLEGLTRLVSISEARAEVVHQVQVTSLLHAAPGLSESLLGHLVQLFSAQAQFVALIGAQHLLEDVLVIRRVPLRLGTVDETLDLTGGRKVG